MWPPAPAPLTYMLALDHRKKRQSEADHVLRVVPSHPLHHFFSDGLTGSPALTSPHKNAEQPDQAATQEDQYSILRKGLQIRSTSLVFRFGNQA